MLYKMSHFTMIFLYHYAFFMLIWSHGFWHSLHLNLRSTQSDEGKYFEFRQKTTGRVFCVCSHFVLLRSYVSSSFSIICFSCFLSSNSSVLSWKFWGQNFDSGYSLKNQSVETYCIYYHIWHQNLYAILAIIILFFRIRWFLGNTGDSHFVKSYTLVKMI